MTGGIPKHLLEKAVNGQGGMPIETDRPCRQCGYNLRGLKTEGACPECGTPIKERFRVDDSLSAMPPEVPGRFVPGGWVCSTCVVVAIVMWATRNLVPWDIGVLPAIFCLISIFWITGVWMVTPELDQPDGVSRGFTRAGRLRAAARWMQLAWLVACLAAVGREVTQLGNQSLHQLFTLAWVVSSLAGLVGIMVLSVMLGRLAEWVRDDIAERAFNWSAWGTPFVSLLAWGILPNVSLVNYRLIAGLFVIWLICLLAFPFGLWSLSRSVTLSLVHSRENQERQERRLHRWKEYDDDVQARIDHIEAARRMKAPTKPGNERRR